MTELATAAQIAYIHDLQAGWKKNRAIWLKYSSAEEMAKNDKKTKEYALYLVNVILEITAGYDMSYYDAPLAPHADSVKKAVEMAQNGATDEDIEDAIIESLIEAEAACRMEIRQALYKAVDTSTDGLTKSEASKLIDTLKTLAEKI